MDFSLLWAEGMPTNILSSECRFAVDGGDKSGRKFFDQHIEQLDSNKRKRTVRFFFKSKAEGRVK